MRTLVICDDYWHPARVARAGLAPLEQRGFEFDWIEHAGEWSAERMAEYRLVVLTKSNNTSASDQSSWVTDQVEHAFRDYVRQGNGLLAIHSGTAGYTQAPVLRALLGGVFISHPPHAWSQSSRAPRTRSAPGARRSHSRTSTISWRSTIRRPMCS
jgi:type 1 glutamine amidotransferase